MNRFAIFVLISATASPALALQPRGSNLVDDVQYVSLDAHEVGDDGATLGLSECEKLLLSERDVELRFDTTVDPTESAGTVARLSRVWLFDAAPSAVDMDCDEDRCLALDEEISTDPSGVSISLNPQTLLQGIECDADRDLFVRLELVKDLDEADALTSADARVRIDVTPSVVPSITSVLAADSYLNVAFAIPQNDDAVRWHVGWGRQETTESAQLTTVGSTPSGESFESDAVDLPAGEQIWVYAWSEDDAGNLSALSEPEHATAERTFDYWEQNGTDHGGCASANANANWLCLALFLGMVGRRRRWLCAAALVLLPSVAVAQGMAEVRIGNATPQVSRSEPFIRHFGTNLRFMVALEGGATLLERPAFGAGVEAGVGYTRFRGEALSESGVRFEDAATLTLLPIRAGVRLRSGPWSRWLALAVRAGLVGEYFRFATASGPSVSSNGQTGRGIQWGWYGGALIGVVLDGADRESSAKLAMDWSVVDTMLFVEAMYSRADDFGSSDLSLGGLQLNGGLGFAF